MAPTHQQIAEAAYALWLDRCQKQGRPDYSEELAVQDWLEAEKNITAESDQQQPVSDSLPTHDATTNAVNTPAPGV